MSRLGDRRTLLMEPSAVYLFLSFISLLRDTYVNILFQSVKKAVILILVSSFFFFFCFFFFFFFFLARMKTSRLCDRILYLFPSGVWIFFLSQWKKLWILLLLILVSKYHVVYFIKKKRSEEKCCTKIGDIDVEFYWVKEETFCIELDILGYKQRQLVRDSGREFHALSQRICRKSVWYSGNSLEAGRNLRDTKGYLSITVHHCMGFINI